MNVTTIEAAKEAGWPRYFTGLPCSRGHVAERYTCDHGCIMCRKIGRERNRPSLTVRNRLWRQKHPLKARGHQIKYRYGVTTEQYDAMVIAQGGCCAICGTSDPETRHGQFHIDHCHRTGTVRGLLCRVCNWMIGAAQDDVQVLHRAVEYLQRAS